MKRFVGKGVILLLIAGFFLFQVWPALKQHGGLGMEIGQEFPSISLETPEGQSEPLPTGSGVLVLNVWATWCGPCRKELPMLQQLADHWRGKGVEVLLLNEEITAKSRVEEYLDSVSISIPNYYLTGPQSQRLGGIGVVPTTFIVSPKGILTHRFNRMVTRSELERAILQSVAKESRLEQEKADTDKG